MKYICLVYMEPNIWDDMSQEEINALQVESKAYDEQLMAAGQFIAADGLESVQSATTVRVRGGKISTTDGPFAETKEILGGFILINVKDLNEAIQVAAGIPLARHGSIEVRPIYEF
jgi:hypothetical protein